MDSLPPAALWCRSLQLEVGGRERGLEDFNRAA